MSNNESTGYETVAVHHVWLGLEPYVLLGVKIKPEDERDGPDDDGFWVTMQAGGGAEERPSYLALMFISSLPSAENPLTEAAADVLGQYTGHPESVVRDVLAAYAEVAGFPMPDSRPADADLKGWLNEHVDHHRGAPVEGCTFCPRAEPKAVSA